MWRTIRRLLLGSQERTYWYLLLSLILFVTVIPFLPQTPGLRWIGDYLLVLVLVAAVGNISRKPRLLWFGAILGLPAVLSRLTHAHMAETSTAGATVVALSTIAFFLFVIALVMDDLMRGSRHVGEKVTGAIVAYLLIGLMWTFAYGLVELLHPGSFQASDAVRSWLDSHPQESPTPVFVYYSFVTLTTLGFGDISPVAATARTLTWLEAVVGQLFIAVTIARLVGIHAATMTRSSTGSDEENEA